MKRKSESESEMENIVYQTPANPPERQDYIFLNGKRHVRPYHFEFIAYVKNRWAGKTIVDLFAEEFKGRPYEYYVSAVKSGRIQVDGQLVEISYVVQNSQKISHFLHRHEPPVMEWGVTVLHKEDDVLTVCKPASVPVHPCGQYRKNTVVGILQAEHGLAPLFPVHRLDRLVSGLLILARSSTRADLFRQQGITYLCINHPLDAKNLARLIEAGLVQKQYIAKVAGVFPEEEQIINANINYNAREGRSSVEVRDFLSEKPLKGKSACTKFTRISTNGTHSIVLCKPVTGRTHQIRVHLQYTGHPIANDTLYLSEDVAPRSTQRIDVDKAGLVDTQISSSSNKSSDEVEDSSSYDDFSIDPMCTNCPNLAPKGYDGHEEGLWLHCFRYSGPEWDFECPYPDWVSL
ncbi:hypothetical protein GIB67_009435 [Kingdonia uniflora]|uniref:Pseudouridine synthase RsuA/RluA-like domain-containing protein n=1 Tax=Kingdonia uniflora TaxID=39325 RepID=A0A7J7N365_9MAGN|nr:hypothetical protein GIB67_009435 [Kingdonia uniflora]